MFSRLWKCLILALCSTAGIACSHYRCNTCSGTMADTSAIGPSTSCKSCVEKSMPSSSIPIVAVKACPYGKSRTYVIISSTPCSTCKGLDVLAHSAPCKTCKSAMESVAQATPAALGCMTCKTAKDALVLKAPAPAAGCSSCQAAKDARLPASPRPLDQSVVGAKPTVAPPTVGAEPNVVAEPHVTAKPDLRAVPKEIRDPVTGRIRYDHARDYSWVVGKLEYLHGKHQWRVRYAPYDVDDELGGVVSLTGIEHLNDQLRSGMTVRIQGNLVNPEARKTSPEYYVYDLKAIE